MVDVTSRALAGDAQRPEAQILLGRRRHRALHPWLTERPGGDCQRQSVDCNAAALDARFLRLCRCRQGREVLGDSLQHPFATCGGRRVDRIRKHRRQCRQLLPNLVSVGAFQRRGCRQRRRGDAFVGRHDRKHLYDLFQTLLIVWQSERRFDGFSHCLQLSASFLRPFASGTALSGTANLHGDWHLGHAAW